MKTDFPRICKRGNSYILRRYVNGKRICFYSRDIEELIEYDKLLDKGIMPAKRIGVGYSEDELNRILPNNRKWKWVKGYDGLYAISDFGDVYSFHKSIKGIRISTTNSKGWYLSFKAISKTGICETIRVHIAVCEAFIGEIPKGYQVHHKNGNKQDNRVGNLEILSPREHCLETIKQNPHCLDGMIAYNKGRIIDDGRKRYAKSKEPKSRFKYGKILQYSLDGEFINSYSNAADAYRDTGVCQRNILQVASKTPFNNKGSVRKQAGGYIWRFEKEVV